MWWVGQRASDGLLIGPDLSGTIACEGAKEADGGPVRHLLQEILQERRPWDSAQLDRSVQEMLDSDRLPHTDDADGVGTVIPYRPSALIRSSFPAAHLLANDVELFEALDDNVQVTPALAAAGLARNRHLRLRTGEMRFGEMARSLGLPFVVKAATSCAGNGCWKVSSPADLAQIPAGAGESVVAAEFLPGPSYNFHGVVTAAGATITFPPSLQIVGDRVLAKATLGYCGNVYRRLPVDLATELDLFAVAVGSWLHERGYRGIFGGDAIRDEEGWSLIDLNPRFQSSTLLLSMGGERGCMATAHRAAIEGRPVAEAMPSDPGEAFGLSPGEAIVQTLHRAAPARWVAADANLTTGVYDCRRDGSLSLREPGVRLPGPGELAILDPPPQGIALHPGAAVCRCWTRLQDWRPDRLAPHIREVDRRIALGIQLLPLSRVEMTT